MGWVSEVVSWVAFGLGVVLAVAVPVLLRLALRGKSPDDDVRVTFMGATIDIRKSRGEEPDKGKQP
jgi:hypothetical protein